MVIIMNNYSVLNPSKQLKILKGFSDDLTTKDFTVIQSEAKKIGCSLQSVDDMQKSISELEQRLSLLHKAEEPATSGLKKVDLIAKKIKEKLSNFIDENYDPHDGVDTDLAISDSELREFRTELKSLDDSELFYYVLHQNNSKHDCLDINIDLSPKVGSVHNDCPVLQACMAEELLSQVISELYERILDGASRNEDSLSILVHTFDKICTFISSGENDERLRINQPIGRSINLYHDHKFIARDNQEEFIQNLAEVGFPVKYRYDKDQKKKLPVEDDGAYLAAKSLFDNLVDCSIQMHKA